MEVVFKVQSDELVIADWTAVSEGVKRLDPAECLDIWPPVGTGMEPEGMDLAHFVSKESLYLHFLDMLLKSQ